MSLKSGVLWRGQGVVEVVRGEEVEVTDNDEEDRGGVLENSSSIRLNMFTEMSQLHRGDSEVMDIVVDLRALGVEAIPAHFLTWSSQKLLRRAAGTDRGRRTRLRGRWRALRR